MDPVKLELEGVLKYHEILWSKILESDRIDHVEIAIAASDVRGKLKSAIDTAGTMFESNMQCLTHILALQKDKASMSTQHQKEIKDMSDRINSLMDVIASLQNQMESSSAILRLKALWEKVIDANKLYEHQKTLESITSEDTTTALAMLSALFATEVSQPETEHGKSMIHHLLQKVSQVELLMGGDVKKYEDENHKLRKKLHEKSSRLHDTKKHLNASQLLEEEKNMEYQKLEEYTRSLKAKLEASESENKIFRNQITELESSLFQTKANYQELTKQYDEAVNIADMWQTTCQKYEKMISKDRPISPTSRIQSSNKKHDSTDNYKDYLSPNRLQEHQQAYPSYSSSYHQPPQQKSYEDNIRPKQSPGYATPSRRNFQELYSPSNSPTSFAAGPRVDSHRDIDELQPAMSFRDDTHDINSNHADSSNNVSHSLIAMADDSPNQLTLPTPFPEEYPRHPDMNQTFPSPNVRAVITTPSPMTDRSYLTTTATTSQHRHTSIQPLPSHNKLTHRYYDDTSTPTGGYNLKIKPGGFISKATEKSLVRKEGRRAMDVGRSSNRENHAQGHGQGHGYVYGEDNRILTGDISMNSSMEKDVTEAVKMISAMMPWDD